MASRTVKASGGTDYVTGYTISAAEMNKDINDAYSGINNITIADTNVIAAANIDPSKVGDYSASSAEYKTIAALATRPAAATTHDFTSFDESLATDLEGEIARIRYAIDQIAGMIVNSSGNVVASEWYAAQGKGFLGVPCGVFMPFFGDTAPTGWILLNDGTIGDTGSGASNRANVDTHELYRTLYNKFSDTLCPVTGGRTTVDADFTAGKIMRLPLLTGRSIGVAGTPNAANRVDAITGTAAAGSAAPAGVTITLNATDNKNPTKDDVLANYTIEITAGAGSGQSRTISSHVASTRVVTVAVAWVTTTDNTSQYSIYKTVPTRTHGQALGSDLIIPTIDTLAGHSHTNQAQRLDPNAGGFDASYASSTILASTTSAGSTSTQYSPTTFLWHIVKL